MIYDSKSDDIALQKLLYRFVDAGLHGRFAEAIDCIAEPYYGIGMGEQGIVCSKSEAIDMFQVGYKAVDESKITFMINDIKINYLNKESAIIFGEITIINNSFNEESSQSKIMQTVGAKCVEKEWKISFTQASPVLITAKTIDAYPLKYFDESLNALRRDVKAEVLAHGEGLTYRDALTEIYNREGFDIYAQELMKAYNPKHNIALFMIDLDNFKQINDYMGHQMGDEVLKRVASAIRTTFREGDVKGRIGGDEFMVMVTGKFSVKFLEQKAMQILDALHFYTEGEKQILISVSIGIAYGKTRSTYKNTYKLADMALYAAKHAGKCRYHLINYDTNSHKTISASSKLVSLQEILEKVDSTENLTKTPYEALVENIPGGVIMFEFNKNGKISFTQCNEWLARLLGYTEKEIAYMQSNDPFVFIHPDDLEIVKKTSLTVLEGIDNHNITYRVRHKNGQYTHINQVTTVTERNQDRVIIYGVLSDVDEAATINRKLDKSRKELETVLSNVPGSVVIFELSEENIKITYRNKWMTQFLGYSEEELEEIHQKSAYGICHPEDIGMLTIAVKNIKEGRNSNSVTYRVRHKDGHYSHITQSIAVISRQDGTVIICGIQTDVEEIYSLKKKLEISQKNMEILLDAIPGGVVSISLTDKIIFTHRNNWVSNLLGYTLEELTNIESENLFTLVHPEDVPLILATAQEMRDGREKKDFGYRLRDRAGKYHHMKINVSLSERRVEANIFYAIITDVDDMIAAKNCLLNKSEEDQVAKIQFCGDNLNNKNMLPSLIKDDLTGLFNKRTFYQETQRLILRHPEERFVLVRWNLERFKVINDLFSAAVGDQVLKTLGSILQKYSNSTTLLARLESDHFVSWYFAKDFSIDTINVILTKRLSPEEIDYPIILKCGIYEIDDNTLPIDQMCDRANLALQSIKGKYMSQYVFYDNTLRQALLEQQEIEGDMDIALAEGQFEIHFQPIFSVTTKKPVSAEALIRWNHPTKGMLPPISFIPIFEKNGFISKLDRYVREQTVMFIAKALEENRPIIPISVNVSRVDFYTADFCKSVILLVEKYNVHSSMLRLEITESAYTHNPEILLNAMRELQRYGFQILMDDFGSGYSSLNMLKDTPVNILKIDMAFVQDITHSERAASVLSSVVRMAKWLEMQVVAEGVETAEQLSFLRSIGCDYIQGYYYSRPLVREDFVKLLDGLSIHIIPEVKIDMLSESEIDVIWNIRQGSTLLNSMIGSVGIYELSGDQLEIICVNDAYYEMTGITPSTLSSETLQANSWIYEDDREFVIKACRDAIFECKNQEIKVRRHHCVSTMIWVLLRIRYIGRSNLRDLFCFSMEDITKQEHQIKLAQIESYVDNICASYDDIYRLDYTNMTSTAIYYTAGNLLNTQKSTVQECLDLFFDRLYPDDRILLAETFKPEVLNSLFTNQKKTLLFKGRILEEDKYWWFSGTIVKERNDYGNEIYLVCIKIIQKVEDEIEDLFVKKLPAITDKIINKNTKIEKLKIMIVDDNQLNRMMLTNIISQEYDVIEAENGQQALQLLAKNSKDIAAILLDIVMPIMDGYEFLEVRNKNDQLLAIPVIVLSHSDARDAEIHALAIGANDFLKKPYEPIVIKHRLKNFINLREISDKNKNNEVRIKQLSDECEALNGKNTTLEIELQGYNG